MTAVITKKRKRERYLVRRLVDGLAGWLTFRQAGGAKTLYSEYFLYPPLYEIASGRAWSVLAQEAITNSTSTVGAPSTLDFVFYKRAHRGFSGGLIMMEVKYLKGDNATYELCGLQEDFTKLRNAKPGDLRSAISLSTCGAPDKWQLIVATRKAYERLSKSKSKKFASVATSLGRASAKRRPTLVYRSVIETKLKAEFHWHVIAMGEKRWPR